MSKTLFDLTLELARLLDVASEGVATGGSATSIADSVERLEADDYWNGGTAWITYDAAGAGASPQGKYSFVSDFANTGGVITLRDTVTDAVAAGDRYAVSTTRYPLQILIQKVNEVLGSIEKTDTTTVSVADSQLEYTLPADCMNLKQVWMQTDLDVNDWEPVHDWYRQKAATGSADKLVFRRQYTAGYAVKLVYEPYHSVLRAAADKLDDGINSLEVTHDAAVRCVLWVKTRTRDDSWNDTLNFYQNLAAQVKQEAPRLRPKRKAKTIHPVFTRP